jgi:hypothetical protein
MSNAETNVLKTIIDALKPLTSEERQRTLEAALVFLGEEAASGENKTESSGENGHDTAKLENDRATGKP